MLTKRIVSIDEVKRALDAPVVKPSDGLMREKFGRKRERRAL